MASYSATSTGPAGDIQEYVAPADGTYRIIAAGAEGGGTVGGRGARIAGTFALTAGDVLEIGVGHHGVPIGVGNGNGNNNASGGGASFVRFNGQPLIVAGGGAGGMLESHEPRHGRAEEAGAVGSTSESTTATSGSSWDAGGVVGSAQPLNGTASGCTSNGYNPGGFGGGGSTSDGGHWARLGGGGGYVGGRGANASGSHSGGGGSSFNAGTNPTNEAGVNEGDGWVLVAILKSVSGVVMDEGGNPVQRIVYIVSRPTDGSAPQVLAHGQSDPVTGEYELAIPTHEEVTLVVVAEDEGTPGPNDPVLPDLCQRVIPG